MADEILKMHHFKKGLISQIQSALAIYKPTNFADLMIAAISSKMDIKRREEENKHKWTFIGQSSQGGKKFKWPNHSNGLSKRTPSAMIYQEANSCPTYNLRHLG